MTAGLEKACHRCLSQIASNACFVFGLFAFLALPLTMAYVGVKTIDDCPAQPMIPLYLLVGGVVGSLKVIRAQAVYRHLVVGNGTAATYIKIKAITRKLYSMLCIAVSATTLGECYTFNKQVMLLLYDIARMRSLISKSVVIGDDDEDEYPWRQNSHRYQVHMVLSAFLFIWFILGNYWVFSVYVPNFIPPFHRPHEYCRKSLYVFAVFVLALSHSVLVLLLCCSFCLHLCARTSTRDDYGED